MSSSSNNATGGGLIRVRTTNWAFEDEPFRAPFGFKGAYLNGSRQTVALMTGDDGVEGVGVGVQSPLWSDAEFFAAAGEAETNEVMYRMTARALQAAAGASFRTPLDLLDELLPVTLAEGRRLSGRADLRLTYALNALVAVDNAAWLLYARATGRPTFDAMLPAAFRAALPARHDTLARIPLFSYGVPIERIREAADEGSFFAKIKVGSDPEGDGDPAKMLAWDKRRLSEIHALLKDRVTPWTGSGHIPYYLDANGRYDSKERLLRFLEHAEAIGALDRILLFEEPFPEHYEADVSDIPARLAADESAHTDADARRRIDMGYGAIALKPIAKTLSMSLRVAEVARAAGVPCFCADLTVCPLLVDWNKNVAARLPALPGLKIGVLESNGHQNYRNWAAMESHHPAAGAGWTAVRAGLFELGRDFYERSGGILETPAYYRGLMP
jgi:L-alanine-DL-glutamate epimerase-like enolase superfamily enzyme